MRASAPAFLAAVVLVLAGTLPARGGEDEGKPGPRSIGVPGRHEAGRWTYELLLLQPGTKSEGTQGILEFDGLPLPGSKGGVYRTPWGDLAWVENERPWGAHGWMPAAGVPEREVLPDPATYARASVRMALLGGGEPISDADRPPVWAEEAARARGRGPCRLLGPWAVLGTEPVVIHDSRHYGQAAVRLLPLDDAATVLRVQVEGTEGDAVTLRRRHGEHALVHRSLGERFGAIDLDVILEVQVAFAPPADGPVSLPPPGEPSTESPAAPGSPPAPPVAALDLEPLHLVRFERDALVFGVMTSGYTDAASFRVALHREEGIRTVGVALVRVRADEGKMVPQPIEVRYPLEEIGLDRPVPVRILNPFGPRLD